MTYRFYLQPVDMDGNTGTAVSIEDSFSGLHYRYCKGLETEGEVKNVYTEDYPEANGLRVFHPTDAESEVHHKETEIELCVLFEGNSRRDEFNRFRELLNSSRLYYWDTARHKKALLVLTSMTEPTEDVIKGLEYIDVAFKFKNVWGITKNCGDDGTEL